MRNYFYSEKKAVQVSAQLKNLNWLGGPFKDGFPA